MHPAFQTPVGYLVLAAALVADPAIGADLDALPALNAAITESSIAGLSSGAFMAVQIRHCLVVGHQRPGRDCGDAGQRAGRTRRHRHFQHSRRPRLDAGQRRHALSYLARGRRRHRLAASRRRVLPIPNWRRKRSIAGT